MGILTILYADTACYWKFSELFENIHKPWPATYSATFGICFLFGDGVLNVHTVQFDIRLFRRVKLPIIIDSIRCLSTYSIRIVREIILYSMSF